MKNYASNFNLRSDLLDSSYKSLSNSESNYFQRPELFKKHSETINDKPLYNNLSPSKSKENLYNQKSTYFKRPSINFAKKTVYLTSMENFCPQDISMTSCKQYKNQSTFDTIFKQKKNLDVLPKTCYSGNDFNYTTIPNKKPSYLQRNSVNYSTLNNFSNCSTQIKLDEARICLSRQKSPYRKSINQKQNKFKFPHTRHVSSYASFPRPIPIINPKIDSTPKLTNNPRPCKTSIKQLQFPDSQEDHHVDSIKEPYFDRIKQPFFAKVDKTKETKFQRVCQKKFSKIQRQPLEKLSFEQEKIENKVHFNLSSQQDIDNYEVTARFNFAQQKNPHQTSILDNTATSIEKNISFSNRKPIELSQFIIGPCKGKGRYGKVYLAIDKETGWICALKQLSISAVKQMLPQFINQIKIQSFLDHPYLTKIYGYFVHKESIFLIMEYLIDGTLYDLIKKSGPVPEPAAAIKLHQISQALSHMHSYHIIHRDLKPENIIISFGVCKICDFGWAVKCSKKRQTSCGTLDYLSPEMIQGTGYSSSIDLWAMGVLLYEMLVGKPPFYNVSVKQTAKRIKQCSFTLPEKLSKESKSLIECFLRKNPGERREIDGILRHPFFQKVEE